MNTHEYEPADRDWPHIAEALAAETYLPHQMELWRYWAEQVSPAEVAAGYEEWADYFEHQLARMADELASDPSRRYLLETWTDSMTYTCRRLAVWALGEDPGEWVPQHERRPDIFAASRAHLGIDDDHDPDRQLAEAGAAAR